MGVYAQTYAQIDAKNMFSAEIWVDTRRYSVIIVKKRFHMGTYEYLRIYACMHVQVCNMTASPPSHTHCAPGRDRL